MTSKLGIVAGGGEFPGLVIAACRAQNRPFHVLALSGHADPAVIGDAPADWIRLGEAGTGFKLLKQVGVEEVVMIGPVRRPTLREAAAAGLRGVAVEAGGALVLGRAAVAAEADRPGPSVLGVEPPC